jgi:hypothetical protein
MDHIDSARPGWNGLYRAGAISALLAAAVFRRNWGAEVTLLRTLGILRIAPETTPVTALEWFDLLYNQRVLGLIMLNIVDVINYALVAVVLLALTAALYQTGKGAMTVAATCGIVGFGLSCASSQALGMAYLSERYVAAMSGVARASFRAAGEALLASDNPGLAHMGAAGLASQFLVTLAGLITSLIMLKSASFGRATAWVGVIGHGIGLLYFVALVFAPALLAIPPATAALFYLAWFIMVSIGLFRLARAPA